MSQFQLQTVSSKVRRLTFANGPFNVVGADTVRELLEVVDRLAADDQVAVVIVDSATPDYFLHHADLAQMGDIMSATEPDGTPTWVRLETALTTAPFVTIAAIRGRTRGGGDELTLALDLRYASRENAIFCQPEVAMGLVPGGGGSDRLARLLGRDRALEVLLTSEDYDAQTAERYGWVTRAVDDDQLDQLVLDQAARIASFDRSAIIQAKTQIGRSTLPSADELVTSWSEVAQLASAPVFQARVPHVGEMIAQVGLEDFERDLAHFAGLANQTSDPS